MCIRLIFLSFSVAILMSFPLEGEAQTSTRLPMIIDADTGNEVDDYYALARAFIEPSWDITALNATQWQSSQWAIPATMENSHRLNQVLVSEMGMSIKTLRGGVDRMFDWGDMAQHSAAAYGIIKTAQALPDGEKLTIVALGALTNVASAIYIEPSIAGSIRLYWLGTTYDFERDVLKRQDFNCMMDQQAVEIVLMSDSEMHVMPINVAVDMTFDYRLTAAQLPDDDTLSRLLLDRWYEHLDGGRRVRVLWDLALIEAMIHPDWTTRETIVTSRDQGERTIYYYSSIDAERMRADFFERIGTFVNEQK